MREVGRVHNVPESQTKEPGTSEAILCCLSEITWIALRHDVEGQVQGLVFQGREKFGVQMQVFRLGVEFPNRRKRGKSCRCQ